MSLPTDPVPALPSRYAGAVFARRGGAGTVYRARTAGDHQVVAVKVLDTLDDRFDHEVGAARRLEGVDGVVPVLDAGLLADGRPFVVTPYFAMGTLADQLADGTGLDPAEVRRTGTRLAATLAAAHDRGVVHGDVKPSNVLLDESGDPHLNDFGSAHRTGLPGGTGRPGSGHRDSSHGSSSRPEGSDGPTLTFTVLYAAPEVLDGARTSPASDQYALGLTLVTALVGRHPFADAAAAGIGGLVDRIRAHGPVSVQVPGAPAGLVAALQRACAPAPADRFPGCAELGDALRNLGA